MADTGGKRVGTVRTYVSYEGMGKHYTVKVGNVVVWTHSFAMDGPIDPQAESLFDGLFDWSEEQ